MPIHRARRSRRTVPCHPFLFLLGFTLLFLAPVLDTIGAAQGVQITAQPTATPTGEFEPPLQARPTATPTPRVTEEPEIPDEAPDDVQANPTAVPVTETVVDDIAPNLEPATLTLTKGVCDDSGFNPYVATGIAAFQDACFSPDGEFEFTVSNGGEFAETAMTSLGSVQFAVPTGNVTVTETIPEGFGEPAVFCWSDILPTPAAQPFIGNGPTWDVAEGEQIECWWFNVSQPAPQGHTVRVIKQVCPQGFALAGDYWTLANGCAERLDGIPFSLTTDGGMVDGTTDANGEIEWTNVDLGASGQVQLDEDIPAGYGEPVVWCVNFPQEAADAQDFDFFEVAAVDGLVTVSPEQAAPHIFSCTYFNVSDGAAPGNLTTDNVQEGQALETNAVVLIKHRCPPGVPEDAGIDQYEVICAEDHDGVEFTLDHAGGSVPGTTENGEVVWTDLPAGDFTIQETVPPGYKDPLVFCGFSELPDDDALGLIGLIPSPGGLFNLTMPGDGYEVTCRVFNLDDGAPESRVVVHKRICANDVDLVLTDDNVINDIITACPETGDGIEFTLDHANGSFTQAIDGDGEIFWDGVPNGPITITEEIPAGYGEPVWYCTTNLIDENGDVQTTGVWTLGNAPGGVLNASLDEPYGAIFACWVFNVPVEDGNSVTVVKWLCPAGFDEETQDPEVHCTEPMGGVTFTLGELEAITGDDQGIAVFEDVPASDDYGLTEVLADGIDHAFVGGCTLNGLPMLIQVALTEPPKFCWASAREVTGCAPGTTCPLKTRRTASRSGNGFALKAQGTKRTKAGTKPTACSSMTVSSSRWHPISASRSRKPLEAPFSSTACRLVPLASRKLSLKDSGHRSCSVRPTPGRRPIRPSPDIGNSSSPTMAFPRHLVALSTTSLANRAA